MLGGRGASRLLSSIYATATGVPRSQLLLNRFNNSIIPYSISRRFSQLPYRAEANAPGPRLDNYASTEETQSRALTDDDHIPWEFEVDPNYEPEETENREFSAQAAFTDDPSSLSTDKQAYPQSEHGASQPPRPEPNQTKEPPRKKKEDWQIYREALKRKFPEGWRPRKKVSPETMELIRALHNADPVLYSTPNLSQEFKISAEAIRRILKSKWRPSADEMEERMERWDKRKEKIWAHMAELGLRPRKKSAEPFADSVRLLEKKKPGEGGQ